jgi:hypothetical protein
MVWGGGLKNRKVFKHLDKVYLAKEDKDFGVKKKYICSISQFKRI